MWHPTLRARPLALCLASAALAACRPGSTPQPSAAVWSFANYDFTFRNGSTVVSGVLEVREGVIAVKPRDGHCFLDRSAPAEDQWTIFKCDVTPGIEGLTLRIDPRDPEGRSRWSGTTRSMGNRSECIAYTTDERGQRICTATRNVVEEYVGSVGGPITLKMRASETAEAAPRLERLRVFTF